MRVCLFFCLVATLALAADWRKDFADPPQQYDMGVYWWWFGPAVTREEVTRELEVMRKARIGSVLIFPIYPISVDNPAQGIKNLRYLSPEFLDVLAHTTREAQRLGIAVDLLMGTGWPFGGPSVKPEHAAMKLNAAPTGMQVKRPSLGAEGLVMDHLSREALDGYIKEVGDKLLDAVPRGAVRAMHSDSMEVFGAEWSGTLLDEFKHRRGYDLRPHLPALVKDAGPLTADVRYDFWRTLSEMALDNYVRPLQEWCHSRGVGLQAESYGSPPVDMASYGAVDQIMGESLDWKMFVASRWASSAAHQYGKKVTSAEAYTWLRFPRYVSTLEDIKLGSDLHFACGVNKIVAHGYAYSPPAAGVPGWGYYASIMMNDNNTWWPYFRLLADYVRRTSYALTLGKPAVDVGIYLPEDDVMAAQAAGRGLNLYMSTKGWLGNQRVPEFGLPAAFEAETPLIKTLITSGFTFDGFDHSLLQPGLKTAAGRLEVGDVAYRIALLPNLKGVSLDILERLAEFCRAGGTLIATRRLPEAAYGVRDRGSHYTRVAKLMDEMFGPGAAHRVRRRAYGRGTAIFVPDDTEQLAAVLATLNPEIRFERPDADLVSLHRSDGNRHLYFLANTSATEKTFRAAFRDGQGAPQFWDAMHGSVRGGPRGDQIPITLEPHGSVIVYFGEDAATGTRVDGGTSKPITASTLAGGWTLSFPDGGTAIELASLKSWTQVAGRKFYSGRGNYETEIEIPSRWLGKGRGVWLDLGEVREIAEVSVNGQAAGVAWKRPYKLDITRWAKPGKNKLKIGVTNLLINRVIGAPDQDYSGLEPLRFPKPTEKKLAPNPLPSGLLGPVRLVGYAR